MKYYVSDTTEARMSISKGEIPEEVVNRLDMRESNWWDYMKMGNKILPIIVILVATAVIGLSLPWTNPYIEFMSGWWCSYIFNY